MSNNLEKAALYTPMDLALISAAVGAGGFGGMRLINDLVHNVSPQKPADNSIKLQLPNPRAIKREEHHPVQDISSVDPSIGSPIPGINKAATDQVPDPGLWWQRLLAYGVGLPAGFLGAKGLYDAYQGHEQDKQTELAKKQYAHQLNLAQLNTQKMGEATPLVDNLCESMAAEFEKSAASINDIMDALKGSASEVGGGIAGLTRPASWKDSFKAINNPDNYNVSPGNWLQQGKSALTDPTKLYGQTLPLAAAGSAVGYDAIEHHPTWLGGANKPVVNVPGGESAIVDKVHQNPNIMADATNNANSSAFGNLRHVANKVGLGIPGAMEDIWLGGTALTTAGLLAALIHRHNKKKEKEQKADYPTTVSYAE